MLEPHQFQTNEAWVAFRLNDAPVRTVRDGDFDCVALMDAASGYILGAVFVATANLEPSAVEARRLFETGWAQSHEYPATLFIPKGQFEATLPAEALRHGVTVVPVDEVELAAFTSDARQGFREHLHGGAT